VQEQALEALSLNSTLEAFFAPFGGLSLSGFRRLAPWNLCSGRFLASIPRGFHGSRVRNHPGS